MPKPKPYRVGTLVKRQLLQKISRLADREARHPEDGDPELLWRIQKALIAAEARAIELGVSVASVAAAKEQDHDKAWGNLMYVLRAGQEPPRPQPKPEFQRQALPGLGAKRDTDDRGRAETAG